MKNRILIIDDDQLNREILHEILCDEYELAEASSGEQGLLRVSDFGPDLVLLDIMLPGINGYEVCRQIKSVPGSELTVVAMVSGRASAKERLAGFDAGADDHFVKPFDHNELSTKVGILFRLRGTLLDLAKSRAELQLYSDNLERLVQERTTEVVETRNVAVFALAKLAESRDPETGAHLERMRCYTQILAEQLALEGPYKAQIDERFLRDIYLSSPLHDVGKVGIPDTVLLKPGRLSAGEFVLMQQHAMIGAAALEDAVASTDSGGFLGMAAQIARAHHERFDGSGYPDGLVGLDIPLVGRIVALADVYDALTSVRVYKSAFDVSIARSMIEQETGKHFDPVVVDAFRKRHDDFLQEQIKFQAAEKNAA
jgi:putative two-component system response regulator